MIPENPEVQMVAAAKKSLNALALELPESVYDDVKAKFLPLIQAVESFDERHRAHQLEQRASSIRLEMMHEFYEKLYNENIRLQNLLYEHHAARTMVVGDNCPVCVK